MNTRAQSNAATDGNGQTIAQFGRCPVCRYRQDGLPAEHQCPECGFVYDEHTRVWRPTSFWKFSGIWIVLSLAALACFVVGLVDFLSEPWQIWLAAVATGLMVLLACGNYHLYGRGPFVAVTPIGILMRVHWYTVRTVTWDQVVDVHTRPRGSWPRLRVESAMRPHVTRLDVTVEAGMATRIFKDTVLAAQARYAGSRGVSHG